MAQFKWINTAGGDFANGANWMQGTVPGASDDALLTTAGTYTVTSSIAETVNSLQIIQNVTLSITGNTFYAVNGTGSGVNSGVISVGNNTAFETGGTIAGAGSVLLNSAGNGTSFLLNANTTLTGGGKLVMDDNSQNYVIATAASDILTNVNDVISGAGQFGNGGLSFANGAAGIVNATGTVSALVLNFGTGTATNAGLIESTGAAGMVIRSSTISQTGTGTLKAAGSAISLDNAVIKGGTLTSTGLGQIQSVNNGEISNVTIAAGSTVAALNNTTLTLDSTITNKGTIALDSAGNGTVLAINTSTVTLTGVGKLVLSDNGNNYIFSNNGTAPYNKLINVGNTISGAGQFGNGKLAVDNQAAGIINATGTAAALVINTGGGSFTNEGLIEDTGPAGLQIRNGTTIVNTGTIGAFGANSHVDLSSNASIAGGTLATSLGGVIQSVDAGTLDGSTHGAITITANSQINDANNDYLYLQGSISNAGTISLSSAGNGTVLWINSASVTLSGGGKVALSDNGNNYISAVAAGNKLINVNNMIAGSGQLGAGTGLAIDNQLLGTINSNGAAGLAINTGGGSFTNEGLIEDTGTGGLSIQNGTTIVNTGTVAAFGAGSSVTFANGSIQGGTLATGSGGVIQSAGYGTLDGLTKGALTISAGSQIVDLNNQYLYLDGSIINQGTIALNSGGNGTYLWINSPTVKLTGGGGILLDDNGQNYIAASVAGDQAVNVNNIISGSGQIGAGGALAFDNQAAGIINSTGAAGMTINNGGAAAFSNEGLIEDSGSGGLLLSGGTTIINSTGTIASLGAGSHIDLRNANTTIQGGTLKTSGGGVIQSLDQGTLDGLTTTAITITAGSQIADQNDDYLYLEGSIVNQGTISLNSGGNGTFLWTNSPTVTLSGGGAINLSDNGQNYLDATAAGYKLINVNNVISGSGQIGRGGAFAVDNQAAGIINSNASAGITINNGGLASFSNEGLIEATSTGGIALVGGTRIVNTGTIAALNGSHFDLHNANTTIQGGTLMTSGGGLIESVDQGTLDGATAGAITITANSQVADQNNDYLYLQGSIVNKGTIALNSAGNGTFLWVDSAAVTLSGGGAVTLSDNSQNYINAVVAGQKLINAANTISGAGQIGNGGSLLLDNQAAGVIDATGSNQLNINLGAATFTNEGLAESAGPGGLLIQNTTLTNSGTIAALSDSSVTIAGSTVLTNYAAGTLTGGTFEAISAGGTHTSTLSIASGPITTDKAHLVLSGAGASIVAGGTSVAATLTTVSLASELDILNGATFASATTLTVGGTILLSGSLSGPSILTATSGVITANGGTGTLSTTGKLTNNGILQATAGGVLVLGGGTLTNAGSILAQAGGTVNLTSAERDTNLVAGKLSKGTWSASGAGATLILGSGTISNDAAIITLSGAGSSIKGAGNKTLESTLNTVSAASQLNVLNSRGFAGTAAGGLSDSGTIALGNGVFSASALTIAAGGTFLGGGTLASSVADNGSLISSLTPLGSTGTLTVTGAISGTGLLSATASTRLLANAGFAVGSVGVAAGATLVGAGSATGAVTVGGTLTLGASGTLMAGSLAVQPTTGSVSGASIIATGAIADNATISLSGGILSASAITLGAAGKLFGFGTVAQQVGNGGSITAQGGTLTLAAGDSGGSLTASAGSTLVADGVTGSTSLTIAAGGSFIGFGTVSGATTDAGTLTASGGTLVLANSSGAGEAIIASGATLICDSTITFGGGIAFASGSNETLGIGHIPAGSAVISGFGNGTTIDILNQNITAVSFLPSTGKLALKSGATTIGQLFLAGTYTTANFTLHSDGNGGTDILFAATPAALADLQGAVAGVAGTAQTAGLVPSVPVAIGAAPPVLGASFNPMVQDQHGMETPTLHASAQ